MKKIKENKNPKKEKKNAKKSTSVDILSPDSISKFIDASQSKSNNLNWMRKKYSKSNKASVEGFNKHSDQGRLKLSGLKLHFLEKADYKVERDGEFEKFAKSTEVPKEHSIVFFDEPLRNGKYKFIDELFSKESIEKLKNVSCLIIKKEHYDYIKDKLPENMGVIVTDYPRYIFFSIREEHLSRANKYPTKIGRGFSKGKDVFISKTNVTIGNNVKVGTNVVILPNTIIGDNVIIRDNCVIGHQSYENAKYPSGRPFDVTSVGWTIIGNNVIIHSNVVINVALFDYDYTGIGENVSIDSNSYIGHGCKIGNNVSICAGCNLLGYINIEDRVTIYAGSTIKNRLTIGKNAVVRMGSSVTKDVEEGGDVSGNFAIDHKKHIEQVKKESKE